MKSSNTWRLFIGALALFAFIYFYENRDDKRVIGAARPTVLGQIATREITAIEYRMSNQVVSAERTNDTWRLTKPLYPAQVTPIETFLAQVVALPKIDVIAPSEVAGKLKEFGLEPPVGGVVSLNVGSNKHQLQIGGRDPIANHLYVQMAGSAEVILTDGAFLKALPTNVDAWRSPMLAHMNGRNFDRLRIQSGQRLLEFERDATNNIWRISKPTPARADSDRIDQLLRRLSATQVKQFVTDLPVVDLERYGLQTPALELSFYLDTNRVTSFEFGASPTNDPSIVYVRRMTHTNIVTISRDLFDDLNQPYKAFHDPRLISVDSNLLSQIRINGTNGFTVTKITNGVWRITEPTPMPADFELMQRFLGLLGEIRIVDFAKDVPSDADLKSFGLAPPRLSIALIGAFTNVTGAITNALISELSFGANKSPDTIYARRSDEIPVYVAAFGEVMPLPNFAWELRDRRIFDFAAANVIAVGVIAGGSTNIGARNAGGWTDDQVQNATIDESLVRIGMLQTRRWVAKGSRNLVTFGITNASPGLQLFITRDGSTNSTTIRFGKRALQNNIYAATVLPGETDVTAFEFPGETYELLARAALAPAQ